MNEDTFIRPIGQIVCHRTPNKPQFTRDQHVIRRNATDERHTGNFVAYCEDSKLAWVFWTGEIEEKKALLSNLMDIEDWRIARKEQASIKNFWGA
jgi:pullulanase/glycogen debranching enzyme